MSLDFQSWEKIGCIGEPMIELSENNDGLKQSIAGDTFNTAVYLQRSLTQDKVSIHYATGLGSDTQSQKIKTALADEMIHTDTIAEVKDKSPGLYMISTDETGERRFAYWRDNSAARFWLESEDTERVLNLLSNMDALYLSGISLAILSNDSRTRLLSFIDRCRKAGTVIIFDNNYREKLWSCPETAKGWYNQMLSITDIALITADDDRAVFGSSAPQDIIARCAKSGIKETIIKYGADPCVVATNDICIEVSAHPVAKNKIIDTTSAGDSFGAGYLAGRMKGLSPEQSAKAAHLLAGTVIQHRGAIIPPQFMPSL